MLCSVVVGDQEDCVDHQQSDHPDQEISDDHVFDGMNSSLAITPDCL